MTPSGRSSSRRLREAGVLDYRIFLDEETGDLFAVLTRSGDHGMDALPATPVMRRWWAMMADIMPHGPDGAPWSRPSRCSTWPPRSSRVVRSGPRHDHALAAAVRLDPEAGNRPDGRPGLSGRRRPANEKNRWFFFRKRVELPARPAAAPISITVDGRYVLYVNAAPVGRGPVRCTPLFQRYDEYDLAPHLVAGANVLAVLVHTYGTDTAFYETVKGMWQPVFGDGGLWVDGAADGVSLSTDGGWRCIQSTAWTEDVPQSNHSLGFIEDLDAGRLLEGWRGADFDDSAWDEARPLVFGGGGAEAAYGGMQTRPFPTLVPRGIPMLEERLEPAKRVVWMKGL